MQLVVIVQQAIKKKIEFDNEKNRHAKELIDEVNRMSIENEYKNI